MTSKFTSGNKQGKIGKYHPPQEYQFKPGESGNLLGKARGKRDFRTDFEEVCREVAEDLRLGKKPDQIKIKLIKTGIKAGLKGKYPFWSDLMNRIYGKIEDKVDINLTSLHELEISMRKLAERK